MKIYILPCIAFSLLLAGCQHPVPANRIINTKASVPAFFGLDSMGVITSFINKRHHTMSILYGNSVSVRRARSQGFMQSNEKMILVTWQQKPDKNWFGANIPGRVLSIEEVTTGNDTSKPSYRYFDGPSFSPNAALSADSSRIRAIFGMEASVMP